MRALVWLAVGSAALLILSIGVMLLGVFPRTSNVVAAPMAATPQPTPEPPAQPEAAPAGAQASLRWRREGGIAGFCDQLRLDDLNALYYGPCREGLRRAEWTPEEMRAYLRYVAHYAAFESVSQDNPGRPDNLTVRLSFEGFGSRVPTEAEQADLARWASDLYARLMLAEQQAERVAQARLHLAQRLGISADALRTVSVEAVDWPDACLGIRTGGLFCAQVITPGYRVLLEVEGVTYEYRTDRYNIVREVTAP